MAEVNLGRVKGDKGDRGERGIQGVKGEQGIKGDKGNIGDQGIRGLKGDIGPIGVKGDRGNVGPMPTLVDNLTSTSTTIALSANQGKVLDGKINTANQQLNDIVGVELPKKIDKSQRENGLWTPILSADISAPSVSYRYREGTYSRMGNIVHLTFFIKGTLTGGSGRVEISGLPFIPNNYRELGFCLGNALVKNLANNGALSKFRVYSETKSINMPELNNQLDISGSLTYCIDY